MSEAGGISCGHHPERPAVAVCIDCETPLCFACRHVGHDGLSRCEACLEQTRLPALSPMANDARAEPEPPLFVPETLPDDAARALPAPEPAEGEPRPASPAEAAARLVATVEPIPWEQAERYSAPLAMWLTLTAILRSPLHAVLRIPWERRDFVTPLVLAVSAGTLGHLGILFSAFLFADLNAVLGPQFRELGVSPVAGALIAMTTVPLGVTLKLFLASGLSHFLLKSVGAARRPYEATFRVFAYAGVTSLLALIPGLGAPLAMAMTLLVVLLGIRVAHRATPGQSFLGAAPHFVALLLEAGV
jgi:hypothetical protein